jgi:hypothetical protein
MAATTVCIEVGKRRVFAAALDWPGWCRVARSEESALAALAAYVPRYAPVARLAGVPFEPAAGDSFDIAERLPGSASTDFGVPGAVAAADAAPLSAGQAARLTSLLAAAWAYLDSVLAQAPGQLRKGPRGGGRDRDKIAAHVLGAEAAYGRKIGLRLPEAAIDDTAAIAAQRAQVTAVLAAASDGGLLVPKGWPARYALRRLAWHVLDHAWEIEDRTDPVAR